jgi:polyhydroxyalkanoate synthesis repressor PhaR
MAETISPPNGPAPAPAQPPVVVKKYANRRLYNTETSSYITLDNLAEMIRAGRDFVVYDAKSGEDITRGVLTQIIVEEESKGSSMLPTAFLRQLIGFYGGSLQGVVPRYLEQAMSTFARQQQQVRTVVQQTFSPFMPAGVEEMGRQNIAMIERAMSIFNPFHRGSEAPPPLPSGHGAGAQGPGAHGSEARGPEAQGSDPRPSQIHAPESQAEPGEVERLKGEIESLRKQLAMAHAAAVVPPPVAPPEIVPGIANVLADPAPSLAAGGAPNPADNARPARKSVKRLK